MFAAIFDVTILIIAACCTFACIAETILGFCND